MSHLLLVAIGPVQEFISSARRFRDLWFSSYVLSAVARAAAGALDGGGNTLVFPSSRAVKGGRSDEASAKVANKLLAIVEGDPRGWAERAKEAALDELMRLAREAFEAFSGVQAFDRAMAEAQVRDLLEFQWVAVPRTGSYADDRRKAERLLGARKNTRDFIQPEWGRAGRPKSSLDGRREAVIDPGALGGKDGALRRRLGLRAGENLCGVGLLKRHGGEHLAVPSTSHMAALGCFLNVPEDARVHVEAAALELAAALERSGVPAKQVRRKDAHPLIGPLNGQVLYESRLKELLDGDEAGLQDALAVLKRFRDDMRTNQTGFELQSYYALLKADGDHMGVALDGLTTPEEHQRFSDDLEAFAQAAGAIVAQHEGFLVYSGGDDVEALLPLHRAIACARELAADFKRRMAPHARGSAPPTLSVGVAVGHQLEPVGETRRRVDAAEKLAKHERDSLGLIVKKRGGSEQRLKGRWGTLDVRLDAWTNMHKTNSLPDGAAYDLRRLATELGKDGPAGAYEAEARRILKRKRVDDAAEVAPEHQDAILKHARGPEQLQALAEELVAARLFAYPGDR
jgi:CRISPR-associated protein Cmr2